MYLHRCEQKEVKRIIKNWLPEIAFHFFVSEFL